MSGQNHPRPENAAQASAGLGQPPGSVVVRHEDLTLPTYLPAAPEKNPMFLGKRVYQGSSGKVYPLPFTDRIAEQPVDRKWKGIWIENEFLRALVLPEIGGRIHALQDKTNGYDLIYRQHVIKPALVGLAGPWISGGIEFNWPQHHRPATFLPVDSEVEEHPDGSKTIWCSDHDPLCRMKGMHGVCLHPGKAWLELKVRAYNRTPFTQTFLWWANVAVRVHEAYQSFFPPDVYYVADHARRSMSEYPLAQGCYYGVNYGARGRHGTPPAEFPAGFVPPNCGRQGPVPYPPHDLSFYANIPVPTSYMCMGSEQDFFGGYDHRAQAGLIHFANHHISPGKKQWTWGNHEFGYAWDRNLTDPDEKGEFGPYIEIMAGVYTDNQPDFSFLQPGETKTWSQYWYPIREIGPAQQANLQAAISLQTSGQGRGRHVRLGVAVTQEQPGCRIGVEAGGKRLVQLVRRLSPAKPIITEFRLPDGVSAAELRVRVADEAGNELIAYTPKPRAKGKLPPAATEPPAPADIRGTDELFITGLHLEQYRHATRSPVPYWEEALRRDPADSRCNNAMGLWRLKRGEFPEAEAHFRRAIERLTTRNANPYDGEAYYHLGLCLRYLDRDEAAYAAFYKATWNQAWAGAGYHALAEIDCRRQDWPAAREHLERSLRGGRDNLRARNLQVMVLRKLGLMDEAARMLAETWCLDRLDGWTRQLRSDTVECDLQTRLDLAHDYARAGFYAEAGELLTQGLAAFQTADPAASPALPDRSWGARPMAAYTIGWLALKTGDNPAALRWFTQAAAMPPDYCFPARLEEIAILSAAMRADPNDARAPYYLGNLLYDRRRHVEAIKLWERSARLDPGFAIVWRNLGIGYFNIARDPAQARQAYHAAFRLAPADARLLYERDQLWKRLGEKPEVRLREMERHPVLAGQRDDLSVELATLYNQLGEPLKALAITSTRRFQPWEGGEGGPLGQYTRAHLALGREALAAGDPAKARGHFASALAAPRNLGEARHLLANQSEVHYWTGCALSALGDKPGARRHWRTAATFKGDFQQMSVRAFSEMTYYSALSWERLGRKATARGLLRELLAHARKLRKSQAKIDYFATSMPTMLLFEDDLQARQETTALFLEAQALLGLDQAGRAKQLLREVLRRDPNHALAADLISPLGPPATGGG